MWFGFGFGIKCINKWQKKICQRKYRRNDEIFSPFFAVALHLAYSIIWVELTARAKVVAINRFPNGRKNLGHKRQRNKFKLFTITPVSGEIAL